MKRAWLFDSFLNACYSALGYIHTCVPGPAGDLRGGECVCPPSLTVTLPSVTGRPSLIRLHVVLTNLPLLITHVRYIEVKEITVNKLKSSCS